MNLILLQIIIVTILLDRQTSADNILHLSLPYYSHINPMVKVAGELTNYGHTSYITIIEKFKGKFGPIKYGVNFIITEEFSEFRKFSDVINKVLASPDIYSLRDVFSALHKVCDRYLLDENLYQRLKSLNASLALVDSNFDSNCLAIFAYRLKIPFILIGAENQINIHRTPWAMSFFPHYSLYQLELKSFSMKFRSMLYHFQDYINPALGYPGKDIKVYAPLRPAISFDDFMRKAELHIIDSDYFLRRPLPALPNVKYIGGIAAQPAEPLKGKLLEFVTASKHGVIVVSPGSIINWDGHVNKMEEAFSKIKYDVVWKQSNISSPHRNILLTKWLPQNDLLGHPNIKLFITHCGNSGQYESLYHAVPIIGLPVCHDQLVNGQNIQLQGYGISMDLNNFTADSLVRNIEEVIVNPKYKKNIAKTSKIFRSQDLPSARVARHVNEILKYGSDHLRSEIQDIPVYEFLMLDILAVLFTGGFIILSLTAFLLRKSFLIACRMKKRKTK